MKIKLSTNIIIGILLVVAAIGYIGNVFEVWHFTLFFPGWWTLFLIIPAVIAIAADGFHTSWAVLLGVGILLLINRLGILPSWLSKLTIPAVILAIGFLVIFRSKENGVSPFYLSILSGRTPNYNGREFTGAVCVSMLGGVDLKLKDAKIKDGAVVYALAILGGVDVMLPPEVNVGTTCIPLLGGLSEPKNRTYDASYPTVKVNAIAILGGIDVK